MEALVSSSPSLSITTPRFRSGKSTVGHVCFNRRSRLVRNQRLTKRVGVVGDVAAAAAEPAQAEITWQIVVGAVAGVTPFVVAGIEFSKRIIAQRKCEICGGSGLVLRDRDYFRCHGCGGFLPWQSWKRFLTG